MMFARGNEGRKFFDMYKNKFKSLHPTVDDGVKGIKFIFAAKDQWRSVTKPYQTYFIASDTKFRKYEWLSIGFNLFTDVVGDGSFKTQQIDLISKFEKKINSKITFSLFFV